MVEFLQGVGTKIVAVILTVSGMAGGVLAIAQNRLDPHHETAAIVTTMVTVVPAVTPSTTPSALPKITPNLLPIVKLASTSKLVNKTISKPTSTIVAQAKKTVPPITPVAVAASTTARPATPAATSTTITAQWLLANTALSFKPNLDGSLRGVFTATTSAQTLTWGVNDATIGGTNGIPPFAFSFSCDPLLGIQDQSFNVRTYYRCTMGFAATTGSDLSTHSKNVQFETGPGQLVVTLPQAMDTILTDQGSNNGGFVFTNNDADPITVTGLTIDISYQGLTLLQGPLTLRFLDPSTNASLFDYNMESVPANPAGQFSYATTGVTIPLSLKIPGMKAELLPFEILGAHLMSVSGLNPTITITLRNVATTESDVPAVVNAAQVQWSCVVAVAGYDPNATSGPYADGTVCK